MKWESARNVRVKGCPVAVDCSGFIRESARLRNSLEVIACWFLMFSATGPGMLSVRGGGGQIMETAGIDQPLPNVTLEIQQHKPDHCLRYP